ncbi:uncharacterized protein SPSK_09034 [Sporothrix schenckii 1099-18]|uniref:C6 zinc finger domain containing protein n=1 Tax=Sporothrix schenckii 1099-18 TaxID=1397361 RepID=A0A0F2MD12_SPOSC|nr:uncharacterized protein SPSK_09034 [Sporothrix schenckii 1099-18]KJR86036.1 hypothetical protein SPSK_09034 [Sporothrix schenckii 1099-18]
MQQLPRQSSVIAPGGQLEQTPQNISRTSQRVTSYRLSHGPLVATCPDNQDSPETPRSVDTFVPWKSTRTIHTHSSGSNVITDTSVGADGTPPDQTTATFSSESSLNGGDTSMALISRDIELTVTIDVLALRTESPHMTTLFLEHVECPGITPFDSCNWELAKRYIVHFGQSCPAIHSCITAVSALYKGHLYALPLSGAQSHYYSAKRHVDDLLNDHGKHFDLTLVAIFLLCLFEFIHAGDLTPHLQEPSPLLVRRLETWSQDVSSHSKLALRIVAWLKILQSSTTRGGATGLLSKRVFRLLPSHDGPIPDVDSPPGHEADASNYLYQLLSGPIFHFYCRLQELSRQIAKLTLYHRSRTTSRDQQEVVNRMASLKAQLHALWESRSVTQSQLADELRAQLAPTIASRLTTLISICNAAYFAELVEIGRQLGDPLSKLPDSRDALLKIRETVERESTFGNQGSENNVNGGFLRALFLYAIESTEQVQIQWAVEKIAHIHPRIYRGQFFSEFAKSLSEAQIQKERRVTSRYFCIWYFGVSPPYM